MDRRHVEFGLRSVGPGIRARIKSKWYLADNLRLSTDSAPEFWKGRKLIYAVVLENVDVDSDCRRQGLCKRLIEGLKEIPDYEMVVVEGVINPHLRDALIRWGWEYDPGVWDFYWRRK